MSYRNKNKETLKAFDHKAESITAGTYENPVVPQLIIFQSVVSDGSYYHLYQQVTFSLLFKRLLQTRPSTDTMQ